MLKFSPANSKTENLKTVAELQPYLTGRRKVYSLDLLSGWSCPFAKDCLARVYVIDGKKKLYDGPETKFRCFSASQEVAYPNVYNARKHNFDALRKLHLNDMVSLLNQSLPKNLGVCRIHVAGDFFSPDYMFAWINVAMMNSDKLFYAYTKSISSWKKYQKYVDQLDNFILTASLGGKKDHLVEKYGFRYAKVVFSEHEAQHYGLEIDHDDSHAATSGPSFALLLHGVQPAGSVAAEAKKALKGAGSYSRKVAI